MKLSIVTNGFINHDAIVPKLHRLEIDSIQVSLDASTAKIHDMIRGVKGSFRKAIEFIDASKRLDLPIGIITTVTKLNFKELPTMIDLVREKKVNWQIQEGMQIGGLSKDKILSKKEYLALILFIKSTQRRLSTEGIEVVVPHNTIPFSRFISNLNPYWDGCWAGRRTIGIQSDGSIKGCLTLPDNFIEGNIRKKRLIDIWNDHDSFAYNRGFTEEDLGELCKDCKYSRKCGGGCLARSLVLAGKLHSDPYCLYRIEEEFIKNKYRE